MKTSQFKKVAQILKKVYADMEAEAIDSGVNIASEEYQEALAQAREAVLAKMGFTLQDYRDAKNKLDEFSSADLMQEVESVRAELIKVDKKHIPDAEEIQQIAHAVAREYIKPPEIINKIVKEVHTKEPQIIKETRVELDEEQLEEVKKDLLTLQDSNLEVHNKFNNLKIPEPFDAEGLETRLTSKFQQELAHNIDLLGMPSFRQLAMGLQAQIDGLGSGSGTVGPGTINELAYFDSTDTVASLTVATYPSLAELSYVKGVTSAIQTQLNAKQASDATLTAIAALVDGAGVLTNDGAGNLSWAAAGAGANTALSNLASVAINTTLVSDTDNTDALGTSAIAWSDLFLGSGSVIAFNSAPSTPDITLTHSANVLTFDGGTFAMGTNSLTLTGSIAATGARVTKGWFTDIESTNMPTVGGTAILTSLTAPQFTTIELGHATANTLSASGGVLSIEGKALINLTDGGTFLADVSVPDEAYGVGWNGSVEVPTKNAVYDKIETISATPTDVQIFTSDGTWTKPSGSPLWVEVICVGSGGGGGAGRKGAAGSNRNGGGGGGAGATTRASFRASDLGATETVVVGTAGTGASAVAANSTNGAAGGDGEASSFGTWLMAGGGGGGGPGTDGGGVDGGGGGGSVVASAVGSTGGAPRNTVVGNTIGGQGVSGTENAAGQSTEWGGAAGGGRVNGGAAADGGSSIFSAGGGGAGGGIDTGNALQTTGAGGAVQSFTAGGGGAGGSSDGQAGTAGSANTVSKKGYGGYGGGGGKGSLLTNGGTGGVGGLPGGGGGGGGGAVNAVGNSGAGGNGGAGIVKVITYF